MSTEPFIGEIKIFAFDFTPQNYFKCEGQTLSIAQYTPLFALIGTIYGGNGTINFQLPDLRGRMPIGQGTGPGLPSNLLGQKAGNTSVTLTTQNLPPHTHLAQGINVAFPVSTGGGDSDIPEGAFLAQATGDFYSSVSTPGKNAGALQVSGQTALTGSGTAVTIINPYLAINFSIAYTGIFPPRP